MASKASILKGTRDFGPDEVQRREYIIDTIREVYLKYGYRPIETPAMEKLETLTGKYGDEGDQLLFKVLNNGDFLAKANAQHIEQRDSKAITSQIAKRGMRYDLTVPFARYVAMHQNDIAFPYKRYQIQNVWRGDRPQKGRYQEFVQCDADVVGSDSLMSEAEYVLIYDEVFSKLGLQVEIHLNNRKVLEGIAEHFGYRDRFVDLSVAIDKWDKIGRDKVQMELIGKGFDPHRIDEVLDLFEQSDWDKVRTLHGSELLQQGIAELDEVLSYIDSAALKQELVLDLRLARGLSYYTGCIFEVKAKEVEIGSISGGGRYDDLTSTFGLKGTSGVGISFGLARIYDVLTELDRFPSSALKSLDGLFLCMDEESLRWAFGLVTGLRQNGLRIDIYPEISKFKKLMKYADQRGVENVLIVGETERSSGTVVLRNMRSGEQESVKVAELQDRLFQKA